MFSFISQTTENPIEIPTTVEIIQNETFLNIIQLRSCTCLIWGLLKCAGLSLNA